MGCSIKGSGKNGQFLLDAKPTGLIMNHAYSILDVFEIPDKEDNKATIKLLVIRNPWATSEWTGKWSDNSAEVQKYRKELEAVD